MDAPSLSCTDVASFSVPSQGVRSFDRTFTVAPAPAGSPAAAAGWPCVILNEQLTVRHYTGNKGWTLSAVAPAANQAPASGLVSNLLDDLCDPAPTHTLCPQAS